MFVIKRTMNIQHMYLTAKITVVFTTSSSSYIAFLDDWVSSEPADLLHFVPYDWTVDVELSQYEIYLFTNRFNWIDIAKGGPENCEH